MPKDIPWRKAIEKVLRQVDTPMHYKEIAEQIVSLGLRHNVGATPAATVSANLTTSINKDGEHSPFIKTGKGEYTLRDGWNAGERATRSVEERPDEDEKQYGIVTSFGMFWRRPLVQWVSQPRLMGMQQIGASPVDFCGQLGIYLLYDGREVIYVGRATERSLGRRLYEHTMDRLSTRWDRFSWFGVLPVSDTGKLDPAPSEYGSDRLLPAIEAILIEALEPRQNRKRGDDLAAVEYLQHEDPALRKTRIKKELDLL